MPLKHLVMRDGSVRRGVSLGFRAEVPLKHAPAFASVSFEHVSLGLRAEVPLKGHLWHDH